MRLLSVQMLRKSIHFHVMDLIIDIKYRGDLWFEGNKFSYWVNYFVGLFIYDNSFRNVFIPLIQNAVWNLLMDYLLMEFIRLLRNSWCFALS